VGSPLELAVQSCLLVVGASLLHIPKDVERQIDLCREYGRETMMLHVHMMDFIWQNYADDPGAARELAGWKDDYINPITDRMTNLREATMSKVAYGTFDIAEFEAAVDKLQQERVKATELIGTLKGAGFVRA
jgi:hypothetical protein